MNEKKINIDFGNDSIKRLFAKMLIPTLAGMLFTALFTITDGIFVGRGLGSEALAAVNIVAPLYLLSTGVGLMFGMGASVIASISLSKNEKTEARTIMTQSVVISTLFLLLCTFLIVMFPENVLRMSGCPDQLMPLAKDYLMGFISFFSINALIVSCGFFVRLSGAPNFAMWSVGISAVINLVLDYIFIFKLEWGMFGAAFATGIGTTVGVIMMIAFLFMKSNLLHFEFKKVFNDLYHNIRSILKIGFASLICEAAIASMMICGNFVFMSKMGAVGVAAFGIACYFFPIIFMVYNAISQSAQPIISFNYGESKIDRVNNAFAIALKTALIFGSVFILITFLLSSHIVSMFIPETDPAFIAASEGLPLFAIGFFPFALNMVSIGYFQSVERVREAMLITLLRGFIFMIICFMVLPEIMGNTGVWLAVPVSEFLTSIVVILLYMRRKSKRVRMNSDVSKKKMTA